MTTAPDEATERPTLQESVPPVREWGRVFLIGIIMGSADAVPGVSGGTIALIAGVYERLIAAIARVTPDRLVQGVRALTPLDGVTGPGAVVVTFVAGGLVGLFTVSRAVRRALDASREVTLAFLVALVVGALRAPVARVGRRPGFSTDVVVAFGVAALAGAVLVLAVDWYAVDLDLDAV